MKEESPRNLVLQVLNRLVNRPDISKDCLDELFQSKPHLNARDRAFISHLVRCVLRWRLRLDWIIAQFSDLPIKKIDPLILNVLRIGLYQILFLDRVPESAAVNEAVNQLKANKSSRHTAPFVNGILRNICREKHRISFPDRDKDIVNHLAVVHSYPEWLVEKWIEERGIESTEQIISAQNRISDLNIRVNTQRIDRSGLIKRSQKRW